MNYAYIENGQVTKTRLPKVGILKNGSTVSNYNLLPHDVLIAEGWLPLIDEPPETDEKHRATLIRYEIYADRVETVYSIEEIVPPAVSEEELLDKAKLKAQQLAVKPLIQTDSLSSNEMLEVAPLFPAYEIGKAYSIGDIFTYKRSLYEVIQAHTSQADWPPDSTPSLYKNHTPTDSTPSLYKNHTPKGTVEEWRQPLGAHDAYMTGDRVLFGGEVYISKVYNNVWRPDVYGWALETAGGEYPEWVQPTGGHDAYALGAIITYNGQLWISIVDANVWEPGVYGWEIYTE